METRFKYRKDKRAKALSWVISILIVALFVFLLLFLDEGYLRAWMVVTFLAVMLLYVLSIPRYIKVDNETLEIHCFVEMTRIMIEDIQSARKVTRREIGPLIPTLASYGFFGYYGYYFSTRLWDSVKVYATEWDNLIEIEDIYEERYLLSCRQADQLIETIMQAKLGHAANSTR